MNHFLFGVARAMCESFSLPEPILEIGSYQVEGQETHCLRTLFAKRRYVGVDMREGPGVDRVSNVENLPDPDGSFGTVISFNTFEHVRKFWRGAAEIHRVLRPDGALLIACPFHFHIHSYPHDYWRFTPQGLESLLENYPDKIIGWNGPAGRPEGVWAIAFREAAPTLTFEAFARFRSRLGDHARHAGDSWLKRQRYRVASWLGGRGYLAPYLERDRWVAVPLPRGKTLAAA